MNFDNIKHNVYLLIPLLLTASGNCTNRTAFTKLESSVTTKSLEELGLYYEDEQNALVAVTESSDNHGYGIFYDEIDSTLVSDQTMDMIFFGSTVSFMRLDAETILHILQQVDKKKIPRSRIILAWDLITGGNNAAHLQGRDYIALGTLLNSVPEEDLYYVNLGDPSVLKFFTNTYVEFSSRVLGVLIASYRRHYGKNAYVNASFINELGYLYCGIQTYDLKRIPPIYVLEMTTETFNKLQKCNQPQQQAFYDLVVHPKAMGPPDRWTSNEVIKLGFLFTLIPKEDIVYISLEAISAIAPDHMKTMDQMKLDYFSYQQVLLMEKRTRRIYILRKQLLRNIDLDALNFSGKYSINDKVLLLAIYINLVLICSIQH